MNGIPTRLRIGHLDVLRGVAGLGILVMGAVEPDPGMGRSQ